MRRRLALFGLVLAGQGILLLAVAGLRGLAGLDPGIALVALASSAMIAWLVDSTVRPTARQAPRHAASPRRETPSPTESRAEQRALARQRRIAVYARRMRRELAQFQAIYRQWHDAVLVFDPSDGRLVDHNPRAESFLRRSDAELRAVRIGDLHDQEPSQLRELIDDVMDRPQGRSIRVNYRTGDGAIVPAEVSVSRIALDTGNLLLCIARDISEREHAAQRIAHLAYHDTLTGLPNRTLLTDRVERALARHRRTGQIGGLLFLDLDRFKRINDSLGHSVGDELLKEFARRLRQTLREEDTVARLGGDEFVVLLEGLGQTQEHAVDKAREIAAKVRGALGEEYRLHGHALYVTASIGIVTFPEDGDSVDTLLRHADTAMYHAKGSGRDSARVFERRMDEAAISRLRFEEEMRVGLDEGQFELYFQPVLAIRGGHVIGAEVLLRWHHPAAGLIAPTDFLPYVENSALLVRLEEWVLGEACRLLGGIQDDPGLQAPDHLAVNVSPQQFHQPDFVGCVREILARTNVDPHRLQFELTETALIKDTQESVERIEVLKKLGIRFAIDDFGTGYSSLSDLRLLPIDTLKIDRSFIRDIASDPHDAAIVRAILSMAGHIGLQVVAEGVETREQLNFLREAGCSFYQGFLGRPPLSIDGFREELRFNGDLYRSRAAPARLAQGGDNPAAARD